MVFIRYSLTATRRNQSTATWRVREVDGWLFNIFSMGVSPLCATGKNTKKVLGIVVVNTGLVMSCYINCPETDNYRFDYNIIYPGFSSYPLFTYTKGNAFRTPDRHGCGKSYNSGWWFLGCHEDNMNGIYVLSDSQCPNTYGYSLAILEKPHNV